MMSEPNKIVLLGDESDANATHEFNLIPTHRILLVRSYRSGMMNMAMNLIARFWNHL